jgi:hypothetical protein
LLCLQHFTGTLDNWDPAVTDPLSSVREVILFENAGVGRSSGEVPDNRFTAWRDTRSHSSMRFQSIPATCSDSRSEEWLRNR